MAELRIAIEEAAPSDYRTPLLVLQHFERDRQPGGLAADLDRRLGGAISRVLERGDFQGKRDETLLLYPAEGQIAAERVLLVGVGKREDYTAEQLRRAVGAAVRQAEKLRVRELAFSMAHVDRLSEHMGAFHAGLATVEAATLAAWDYRELKTSADAKERVAVEAVTLLARDAGERGEFERAAAYGAVAARAENFARELQTLPGNIATPTYLAGAAERIAAEHGLSVTVLDRAGMEREGMKALLAVAQGSEEEPRFIALEYHGGAEGEPPLVLIGKGITFDTGGISIKPAERMEEMKYDMSGAAAVLAAMKAIAELRIPANVVGLVPSTENMPSGTAVKPGDVIGSLLGKTIEVINTDAEGRLVLADALAYARRYNPRAMIDAATLTGACVIALGHHAIGLMGNDGDLIDEVRKAGQRVGERCWPLPLWDEYRPQIDSAVADIKNTGGRPAGTITAGWFLKEFAGEIPWAHLDIAGTAWRDDVPPYLRKGATGVPTRLFIEWVRSRAG
ncbi:MAG TPA: leucyl aminopeptidase [Longimicrobiales bacterium]|nr:leucyl aminopeptidase [Longimicrobiales bacterium]